MNIIVERFAKIKSNIEKNSNTNSKTIVAVSKTFSLDHIMPLINHGHLHYGENKVQEAFAKWHQIKKENKELKLHMIGKLQSNKAKKAVELFDYIHSVDNQRLADTLSKCQLNINKSLKYFIQVNIGNEEQKFGVDKSSVAELHSYCKTLNLEVVGLMCIPPLNESSEIFFKEMNELNKKLNFEELSMGMSSDYLSAIKNSATYVRIGSNIFGQRS